MTKIRLSMNVCFSKLNNEMTWQLNVKLKMTWWPPVSGVGDDYLNLTLYYLVPDTIITIQLFWFTELAISNLCWNLCNINNACQIHYEEKLLEVPAGMTNILYKYPFFVWSLKCCLASFMNLQFAWRSFLLSRIRTVKWFIVECLYHGSLEVW